MTRVKSGPAGRNKHKRILKLAKGYRDTRSRKFRRAHEAVLRAGEDAFAGRKQRRRDLRRLWIARLNGALFESGLNYSRFIKGLKQANITINRKMLSEMAIHDTGAFEQIVKTVKEKIA